MTDEKPRDQLIITKGGAPHHLTMTFGLLNELGRVIGDLEAIPEISFNIELRNEILTEVFSERDEEGRITSKVNLFNLDIHQDEIVTVLDWVGANVADFLLKQMVRAKALMEKHQSTMQGLMPTSNGSQDSTSVTP